MRAFFIFKIMNLKILITLYFISFAHSASISGFIRDADTGEPLSYANIIILNSNIGVASDNNGYYIIPNMSEGNYILKVMIIGYVIIEKEIIIYDKNLKVDLEIKPEILNIDEIKVSAERMRFENKVDISRVNLTNRDIRRNPAFIESDVFRTLQLLPSVTTANDFNASLIVRGGSPDENLIILDGVEIYNPYHVGGVFSTFNADMISDVEFLAGGAPAQYSGRLSSVLSITSREGNSKNGRLNSNNPVKKYWDFSKANGEISLLSTKFLMEGPLYNGSWIFSGRRTYFDQFLNLYYNFQDKSPPINYYFWDMHFKASTSINNYNKLIFSTFSGYDDLFLKVGGGSFPGITFYWDWGNKTSNLTWKYLPNDKYFVNTSISKTKYNFDVDFAVQFLANSNYSETGNKESADLTLNTHNIVEDYTITQNMKYIYLDNISFNVGWELKSILLNYRRSFDDVEIQKLESKPQIISSFFSATWNPIPHIHINSGLRLSKYNRYEKLLISPRLGMKVKVTSDWAFKWNWGTYYQYLYTTNEENELLRIVDFWQPIPDEKIPQKANHYIIGSEYWISESNTISIETYYKSYKIIYELNPLRENIDLESTLGIDGEAISYGLELLYRLNYSKISGWIGYSYMFTERTVDRNSDGVIWVEKEKYPAKYDKPHSFTAVLNYELNKNYSIGFSCNYSSGQTYTPVIGKVYQAGEYGTLESPYSDFGNVLGVKNSSRYPDYIRVDISILKHSPLFGIGGKWKFQIINITNNFNVLFYNWDHLSSPSKVEAYSMFPITFSFGWEYNI